MKNVRDYGHLAKALGSGKSPAPVLSVTARMGNEFGGGFPDDSEYRKKELVRLRKEVKATSDQITNWDAEDVAARALKSLKADLAMKKARLMECEAVLGEESAESLGEEGAEGEGAVIGGPYQIQPQGNKFVVSNMETGHVKGTHATKKKALRQFRLLEMKAHEEKK